LLRYREEYRSALYPSLFFEGGAAVRVNPLFLELSGYEESDLLLKSEDSVLKLLRANFSFHSIGPGASLFIFTRDLEPREVEVSVFAERGRKLALFREKPHSRIEQMFPYVAQQLRYNLIGTAVFLADGFILLKANQLFLDFQDKPYNTPSMSAGESLHKFCTGFRDSASHKAWQNVVDTGEPLVDREFAFEGFKRGVTYWDVNIMPVFEDGSVKYLVETAREVTQEVLNKKTLLQQKELLTKQQRQLKQLVGELRKADRNKNEFLNLLSHELRNPLATINTGLSLMQLKGVEPKNRETLDIIRSETRQLSRLIDELLDITRITNNKIKLKKERFDLNELALKTVRSNKVVFNARDVGLDLDIGDKPIFVDADPIRISQIIGNLLNNSLKFTKAGGRTLLSVRKRGDSAYIVVTDNGTGIDSEFLPELFEPFKQARTVLDRQDGGLGLGLSIVKGLAELHGGSVSARSDGLGKGSEFTIFLPTMVQ